MTENKQQPGAEKPTQTESANKLSDGDRKRILERSYELLQDKPLGEGSTREAYLARYKRGDAERLVVLKVAKREVDPRSITTRINRSKRDLDLAEVTTSNRLAHPYICEVLDSFTLDDGRRVNVEPYEEGTDLERMVNTVGPIADDKKFYGIAGQLAEALRYLHKERRMVHRDIKPSNILITPAGTAKLGDLQNAARIAEVKEGIMLTRGGTAFAHPDLIDAPLQGIPSRSSERTDLYSLAATLYFLRTGKQLFPYQLVPDEGGVPIEIGGEQHLKIALTYGDSIPRTKVDRKEHQRFIRAGMKSLPRRDRGLVRRCLVPVSKGGFEDIEEFTSRLKYNQEGFLPKLRSSLVTGAKFVLPALAIAGVTALSTIALTRESKRESTPVLSEVMRTEDYSKFSLEDPSETASVAREYMDDMLWPYMKKAQKLLPLVEESRMGDLINFCTQQSQRVNNMDPRLVSSWLRACALNPRASTNFEEEGRIGPVFTPERFMIANDMPYNHGPPQMWEPRSQIAYGVMYLKQCLGPSNSGRDVADAFANYFCSSEDINTARTRTNSVRYFPYIGESTSGLAKGPTIRKGYGLFLPSHEQDVVNTATALYLITDNEGKVHFDKIPQLTRIPGTLTQKLRENLVYDRPNIRE